MAIVWRLVSTHSTTEYSKHLADYHTQISPGHQHLWGKNTSLPQKSVAEDT